jgi:hypothetical protein
MFREATTKVLKSTRANKKSRPNGGVAVLPEGSENHCVTVKTPSLVAVPPAVVIAMGPVFAPGRNKCCHRLTLNIAWLVSVPLEIATVTLPVVAPAGTVAVISVAETTLKVAAVPLKRTLVAPVKLLPKIVTSAPTMPEPVRVSTKGFSPADRLKTVP